MASSSNNETTSDEKGTKVATSKLISQGHENFELIFMMLMGIRTSVGKFANAATRSLTPADFDQKWDGDFLSKGSTDTPAHNNHDFKFKDYAPLVFREVRERCRLLPLASHSLPTAPLPNAHCPPPTACFRLLTAHRLPRTAPAPHLPSSIALHPVPIAHRPHPSCMVLKCIQSAIRRNLSTRNTLHHI